MPIGWRKSFGIQMCKDLRKQLWKEGNLFKYRITQIKEKWGYLCMYLNYYVKNVQNKIDALEEKSHNICENCGSTKNVTTKAVNGWISTLCDKCRKVNENT